MSTYVDANLSINSYLNKYYKNWTQATQASSRKDLSTNDLITADATALRKGLKNLESADYSSSNGGDIYNSLSATIETYNHLVSSTSDSDNEFVTQKRKQMKQLFNDHADEFAKLGITMKSNGQLDVDDDTLSSIKVKKVSDILGEDSEFSEALEKISHKLQLYTQTHKETALPLVTSTSSTSDSSTTGLGTLFDSQA